MNVLDHNARDYFHGILNIVQDDQGVRLQRMTDNQIAHYKAASDNWHIRSHCNAGAILTMRTDSPTLDIMIRVPKGAREYMGIDVEIDGRVERSFYVPDISNTDNIVVTKNDTYADVIHANPDKFAFRLFEFTEQKDRLIRVYLPQSVELQFLSVTVAQDATVEPVDPPKHKLLCLGDSITQGMDAIHPITIYPTQLANLLNADMLNQGVGGHVFDPDSFDPDLPYEADGITIAYGTNDWNGNITADQIRDNVHAYLTKIRARYPLHQTEVAVISPIWRAIGQEERAGGNLIAFSQIILNTARDFGGIHCIDGLTLVPHRDDLMVDGTHPNDEGFLHYATNLYRAIQKDE